MSECQQTLTIEQRDALEWLANGETGISSKTLVFWVVFHIRMNDGSHPYDPYDLNRCIKVLNAIPSMRRNLHKMADISMKWKGLVSSWGVLEQLFMDEVGLDWCKARRAPKTYELMERIFDGEAAEPPSSQAANAC